MIGITESAPVTGVAGRRRATELLTRAITTSHPAVHAIAVSSFLVAGAASAWAQNSGRPITAAIVFLLAVTIAGALEGVWGGLLAALAASAVYNFFLIEPTFRFSLATLEDYVPIIAFNLCAVTSGWLTGRLKDRAIAAEQANRRAGALLNLSERLQGAVNLPDVLTAVRGFLEERGRVTVELYASGPAGVEPVEDGTTHQLLAADLFDHGKLRKNHEGVEALLLPSSNGPIGVLVFSQLAGRKPGLDEEDLAALVNLLTIAVERCVLLRQLAEAELVRKSEEFKTALLSSVSHDLRTPLSAISASATSLASYGNDLSEGARQDMLRVIEEQCSRLNRYTANLLSLGRLQGGLEASRLSLCDAVEVLGSAIAQTRRLGSGHSIVKKFAAQDALVRADPAMLEQVFYNVLENSVRYSERGTEITVSATVRQTKLLVSIRDRGRGIPQHEFDRIFDRFYRTMGNRGTEGSGLGLAIAKGFLEAVGGRICAGVPDDEEGGTIMTIELATQSAKRREE